MIEHIEQRIEDLTPTNGDLIAASEYVRDCRYLINEYEECRDDALILSKQVEELQKALEEIYIHTRTTELANLNWIAKQALKGVNRNEL